ncbi:hypothetical protein ScPMuIL_010094 [Solemya velum]
MPTIPPGESDWQTGKTLSECTQFMLEHEIACDVTFLLGETKQEVRAHKFILISRSPVFSAMFCGPMAGTQEQITIPDIAPEVFTIVLRYMYSDQLSLLDPNIVMETLYAAKKYSVVGLAKACKTFCAENINVDNACLLLDHAYKLDEQELSQACRTYILKNGERCLQSATFCKMSRHCVEKVVEADDLSACELSVWEALVRWAEAECERQGVAITGMNLRQAMGDLVYSVRFRGISPDMFAKHVSTKDILTLKEVANIFQFYHKAVDVLKYFSTRDGRLASVHDIIRCVRLQTFGDLFYIEYDGKTDAISFTVSAPVVLRGIMLYGCCESQSQYMIKINVIDASGNNLLSDDKTVETCPDEETFDILFDQRVTLAPSVKYSIYVTITGESSYYGCDGQSEVTTGDVTVTFSNCSGRTHSKCRPYPPAESDWQTGKTLSECTQFMLEHEIAFDVTFLLGETKQEVRAHKFMLISRSPVFSAMFCGPMAETQEQITIPDVAPEVFKLLLRYMYSDQLSLLDPYNVLETLYAAKKYFVAGLVKACKTFCTEKIDVDNACVLLEHAYKLDEQELFQACRTNILKNGERCLQSATFCKMSRHCVEKVVEADDLSACELSVWKALVGWAEAECERQGVAITDVNIRQAMGDLIYSVRFRGISPDIFAKHISTKDILTLIEVANIFQFFHKAVDVLKDFSTKDGRLAPVSDIIRCVRLQYFGDCGIQYHGRTDAISFTVSVPVVLRGIMLYSCKVSRSQYQIKIDVTDASGNNLLSDDKTLETCPDEQTFDVIFNKGVSLATSVKYSIYVTITGETSYYGCDGQSVVTTGDVTVTFSNCSGNTNATCVTGGQIPGLLLHSCS